MKQFHVGPLIEIDDFPMLWTWFEEDALLEKMGHPRLHTDADGYFTRKYLWDLLIERIGLEYQKKLPRLAPRRRAFHHPDRVFTRFRAWRLPLGLCASFPSDP